METRALTSIEVRNPRTGEIDYMFTPADREEIAGICDQLRQGQTTWGSMSVNERIAVLQDWKQALQESRDELIGKIAHDTGRWKESVGEFESAIRLIDRFSRLAPDILELRDMQDTSMANVKVSNAYDPYPLVGVISPWNFPFSTSLMDTIPALVAGCAVIVKPSEVTPRFIETVNRTVRRVPQLANVLAFIAGDGRSGAELIDHVDLVCFTGSVATGRKVAVAAAQRFIPSILELGGKDAAIVLESADLERATDAILYGAVRNAGQLCVSIERIYVAAPVFEAFTLRLVEKAMKLELAYPNVDQGDIGPLIFAKQADIISDHLQDAVSKGARIHCGGQIERLGGGLWCRPTVVTRVHHDMKLMKEETFGPIMPIMPFKDADEAVRLANDSVFGLSGAVFAGTAEEAVAVGRRLHTGGININDCGLTSMLIGEGEERTSFHCSGMGGSRSGKDAVLRFVRKKALFANVAADASPWWYKV